MSRLPILASVAISFLVAACGGSIESSGSSEGGTTPGPTPGTVGGNCGPKLGCQPGERETTEDDCQLDYGICHTRTGLCGQKVYCREDASQCDGMPVCDQGDTRVADQSACLADDAKCYSRSLCGMTIWCTGPSSLVPSGVTSIFASSSGGFKVAPPPGSQCSYADQSFTYDVASKVLSYEHCVGTGAQPLVSEKGKKLLVAAEETALFASLAAMTLPTTKACGADKPLITVEVSSTSAPKATFVDSFYQCYPIKTGIFVDNIDGVMTAFHDAAFGVGSP